MTLDASLVGKAVGRIEVVCDARWAMAYAAGIPDERSELYDTTQPLVVHPMFPVAPEWELLVTHRTVASAMPSDEVMRGVHAAHDLVLERPIPVGERLTISAHVVAVDRRPAGASQQTLFVATDTSGAVVWRTMLTSVFRGVDLDGDPTAVEVGWPAVPLRSGAGEQAIAAWPSRVRSVDAHIYTECARIWNPIHTDVAVARAAGLSAPILHGTATLARAVSACTDMAGVRLADVTRIGATFGAMVALDSTIEIRLLEQDDGTLHFEVLNHEGQRAIRHGCIQSRPARRS